MTKSQFCKNDQKSFSRYPIVYNYTIIHVYIITYVIKLFTSIGFYDIITNIERRFNLGKKQKHD